MDLRVSEAAVRAPPAQLSRRLGGVTPHTNAPVPIVGNTSGLSILTCSQIVCHRSERQLWRFKLIKRLGMRVMCDARPDDLVTVTMKFTFGRYCRRLGFHEWI